MFDGTDLQLGDVVSIDVAAADGGTSSTFRVIGNFHSELATVSGVYNYSEPNVSDFRVTDDGVEYVSCVSLPEESLLNDF